MSKELEIARISDLPDVTITDGAPKLPLKKVHISKQTLEKYHDALNPRLSFGYRLRRFLSAQSEYGRIAKTVKDLILIFVPYGRQIDTLTDFVTERLIPKTDIHMTSKAETFLQKVVRFLKQKSTRRGVITIAALAGALFGLNIQADVLINSAVGIATGATAIVAGFYSIKDIFTDE